MNSHVLGYHFTFLFRPANFLFTLSNLKTKDNEIHHHLPTAITVTKHSLYHLSCRSLDGRCLQKHHADRSASGLHRLKSRLRRQGSIPGKIAACQKCCIHVDRTILSFFYYRALEFSRPNNVVHFYAIGLYHEALLIRPPTKRKRRRNPYQEQPRQQPKPPQQSHPIKCHSSPHSYKNFRHSHPINRNVPMH